MRKHSLHFRKIFKNMHAKKNKIKIYMHRDVYPCLLYDHFFFICGGFCHTLK